jgi:hypothetical protein
MEIFNSLGIGLSMEAYSTDTVSIAIDTMSPKTHQITKFAKTQPTQFLPTSSNNLDGEEPGTIIFC